MKPLQTIEMPEVNEIIVAAVNSALSATVAQTVHRVAATASLTTASQKLVRLTQHIFLAHALDLLHGQS